MYYTSFFWDFQYSYNQAKYEALVLGLLLFKAMQAMMMNVLGHSLLILSQILGEYKCEYKSLIYYCAMAKTLIGSFFDFFFDIFSKRKQYWSK